MQEIAYTRYQRQCLKFLSKQARFCQLHSHSLTHSTTHSPTHTLTAIGAVIHSVRGSAPDPVVCV